jgi:hypothetical protein
MWEVLLEHLPANQLHQADCKEGRSITHTPALNFLPKCNSFLDAGGETSAAFKLIKA